MKSEDIIRVGEIQKEAKAKRANVLMVAPYRPSLQAARMFLYIISKVERHHNADTQYVFKVGEMARVIGIDRSRLYLDVVNSLEELMRIMVNIPDAENENITHKIGLIVNHISFETLRKNKKGLRPDNTEIVVRLHEKLIPYVVDVKNRFTEIELKYYWRLESSYAQKLYDLLKSENWKKSTYQISKEDLLHRLVISEGQYKRLSDLKRYVIELAIKDINAKTDLKVSYEYVKQGRKVVGFIFHMQTGAGDDVPYDAGTSDDKLFKILTRQGMASKTAQSFVDQYKESDPERITWSVGELERQLKVKPGSIKSPAAWLTKAIKEDYRKQQAFKFDDGKTVAQSDREERAKEKRLRQGKSIEKSEPKSMKDVLGQKATSEKWDEFARKMRRGSNN